MITEENLRYHMGRIEAALEKDKRLSRERSALITELKLMGYEYRREKVVALVRSGRWVGRDGPLGFSPIDVAARSFVNRRDQYQCVYCGALENLTVDHVVPRSKGGKHSLNNLVTACFSCNSSKSDTSLDEWVGPSVANPTVVR